MKLPDKATQDALLSAIEAEAVGADAWVVTHEESLSTASVVEQVGAEPDLYRLVVTCRADTGQGQMQLAWSPGVPKSGQLITVSADGKTPFTYKVEGNESMGNGQAGTSGPGAKILDGTLLPEKSLTVTDLFPNETVVFPLEGLSPDTRKAMSACFGNPGDTRHAERRTLR